MSTNDSTALQRAEYIAGLRVLADLLESDPDLVLPTYGAHGYLPLSVHVTCSENQREELARWSRAIPGTKTKQVTDDYMRLGGMLRGLHIKVVAARDEVCERVVVGTREVTEEVPDPQALAAVPKVTVTRTVEEVEWRCTPLLSRDGDRDVELAGAVGR